MHAIFHMDLLSHLWVDTGSLQTVVEVGVALNLDGEGTRVGFVDKRLSLQEPLRTTVTCEQLHHWIVAGGRAESLHPRHSLENLSLTTGLLQWYMMKLRNASSCICTRDVCPGWDYLSSFPLHTFLVSVLCICNSMYIYNAVYFHG